MIAVLVMTVLVAMVAAPATQAAEDFDTRAEYAFMIDMETRAVLLEKSADVPFAPASMAKLMTAERVFAALEADQLSLDDEILISEKAWRMRGSRMFAEVGSQIRVEDLLRGLIVHSGNDAAVALAEALAGSEEAFAEDMTDRARDLGLTNTTFTNASGLDDPEQRSTARDLAVLAMHLIETYPQYYGYFSEESFTWNDINQSNRNRLLGTRLGVDGLKTGHVQASGYGMVASAVQDGRRLVLVVGGLGSERQREDAVQKILSWGFRTFQPMVLFPAEAEVARVPVFGGDENRVSAGGLGPVTVLVRRGVDRTDLRGRLIYDWPVEPTVERGDPVGALHVLHDGRVVAEVPLFALETVGPGDLHERALDGVVEFFAQMLQ